MLGFSAGRRRSSLSAEQSSPDQSQVTEHGLFEGDAISDGVLETLLIHSQDVSMWVAVEICSAPSVKVTEYMKQSAKVEINLRLFYFAEDF